MNLLRIALPLALLSALAGCDSVSNAPAARPATTTGAATVTQTVGTEAGDGYAQLRKGLTMDDVKALVGEPLQVRKEALGAKSTVADEVTLWVYGRTLSSNYRTIVAEMEEVPAYDPLTGEATPQQQPINSQERIDRTQLIVLAFTNGVVTDIQSQVRESKQITR